MNLIINTSTDPAFNLALEEYLLAATCLDVVMLWRNERSVIIGKNQNAFEEIDLDFVKERGIKVIRRQSGGGAVFHDLGNINFTIIQARGGDDFSNFARFTAPIVGFLRGLGVTAELHGRNDLVIDGMKFSGNAQAVKGGRIMHHGTILFNADLEGLAGALRPNPAKIESKGIKSVRSRVTNVAAHLKAPMGAEEFFNRLCGYFKENAEGMPERALTDADRKAVGVLVDEKYSKWEYNFGSSPDYSYRKSAKFESCFIDLRMFAERGEIKEIRIFGDFFGELDICGLEGALLGSRHDKAALRAIIHNMPIRQYIHGITEEDFLSLF